MRFRQPNKKNTGTTEKVTRSSRKTILRGRNLSVYRLFLQSPANPDLLYLIFFCHTQLTVTLLLCLIFGSKVRLNRSLYLPRVYAARACDKRREFQSLRPAWNLFISRRAYWSFESNGWRPGGTCKIVVYEQPWSNLFPVVARMKNRTSPPPPPPLSVQFPHTRDSRA